MRTKHKILRSLMLMLICASLVLTGTLDRTGLHFNTVVSAENSVGSSGSGSDNTSAGYGTAEWQNCYTFGYRVYFADASEIAKKSDDYYTKEINGQKYKKFQAKTGVSALQELNTRQRWAVYGVYGACASDLVSSDKNGKILNWNVNKESWSMKVTDGGTSPNRGVVLALDSEVSVKSNKMTFAKLLDRDREKLPEVAKKTDDGGTSFNWDKMQEVLNNTVSGMFEKGNEKDLKAFVKNYVNIVKETYGKETPDWISNLIDGDGEVDINKFRAKKIGEFPKYCLIFEPVMFARNGNQFACLTSYNGGTANQNSSGYITKEINVFPGSVADGKYQDSGQCGFRARAYSMRGCHEGDSTWTVSEANTGARGFTYWWAMNNPQSDSGIHSGTNIMIDYSGDKITTESTEKGLFTGTTSASTTGYLTDEKNDVSIDNESADDIENITASIKGLDNSSYLLNTRAGKGLQNKWDGVKLSDIEGDTQYQKLTNSSKSSKALYRAYRYKLKIPNSTEFKLYTIKADEYDISGTAFENEVQNFVSQICFKENKVKGDLYAGSKYQVKELDSIIRNTKETEENAIILEDLMDLYYPTFTMKKDKEWGDINENPNPPAMLGRME